MHDGPVRRADPLVHELAGPLVVLADRSVRDGVDVIGVDRHSLIGVRRREAVDLLESEVGQGGGRDQKDRDRCEPPMS